MSKRSVYLFLLLLLMMLSFGPARASAQRRRGINFGIGIGRFITLRPLATASNSTTEYKLASAASTGINIDYWWTSWLGTRLAYQWVRSHMAEPEGPSFARLYTLYGAALLSPLPVQLRRPPFLVLGAGARRYDVSSPVIIGNDSHDLAPRQNRPTAYGGVGFGVSFRGLLLAPEAGVMMSEFKHDFPCLGCVNQKNTQADLILSFLIQFGR